MIRFALFDLDNTLYPPESGLWAAIGERISLFMIDRLGMNPETVAKKRDQYLREFGTTLQGLQQEHDVNPMEFLTYVHDLPLEKFLRYDPALDRMLERMPQTKVIFTNADAPHARRVLAQIGVGRHFGKIIDIHALDFINKPDPRAYRRALDLLEAKPEECLFVEDSAHNLVPARAIGMHTVLIRSSDADADGVHHRIPELARLEKLLAGLSSYA